MRNGRLLYFLYYEIIIWASFRSHWWSLIQRRMYGLKWLTFGRYWVHKVLRSIKCLCRLQQVSLNSYIRLKRGLWWSIWTTYIRTEILLNFRMIGFLLRLFWFNNLDVRKLLIRRCASGSEGRNILCDVWLQVFLEELRLLKMALNVALKSSCRTKVIEFVLWVGYFKLWLNSLVSISVSDLLHLLYLRLVILKLLDIFINCIQLFFVLIVYLKSYCVLRSLHISFELGQLVHIT